MSDLELTHIVFMVLTVCLSGLSFIVVIKNGYLDFLDSYPLDFARNYRGKRIFGPHKTVKGPFVMGFSALFYGQLLFQILDINLNIGLGKLSFLLIVLGLSYSLGELPNSFIKRQLGISPSDTTQGKYRVFQKLADNFDSLIACGFVYYFFGFHAINILMALLLGGFAHLATDMLMRCCGLKR